MDINELSRRSFLLAGGAVVAGGLVGCGGGGFAPLDVGLDTGDDVPVAPASDDVIVIEEEILEAIDEARATDSTLAYMTRHDFDRWHDEAFEFTPEGGQAQTLVLGNVEDHSNLLNASAREYGLREPFSVQFYGPEPSNLPEGRHTITHPDMGEVIAHVIPQGSTADREGPLEGSPEAVYEIFFN